MLVIRINDEWEDCGKIEIAIRTLLLEKFDIDYIDTDWTQKNDLIEALLLVHRNR